MEAELDAHLRHLAQAKQAWSASDSPPGDDDPPGESTDHPSKHLWLGNLSTKVPRAVLKAVFEKFGPVDDVVTFPGRMYAFVNYRWGLGECRDWDGGGRMGNKRR